MSDRERRSRRPARSDVVLAAALLVLAEAEVALRGVGVSPPLAFAFWALAALATLGRRRWPIAFALWACVVFVVVLATDVAPPGGAAAELYQPLALFGLGAYVADVRRARIAAVAGPIVTVGLLYAGQQLGWMKSAPVDHYVRAVSILAAAAAGGVVLRDRTELLRAARRRSEAAAAAAPSAVELALARERAGLARELHAVVTACVRDVREAIRPAQARPWPSTDVARAALRQAQDSGQQAMAEMRRMLTLLRARPRPASAAAPPPAAAPDREALARAVAPGPARRRAPWRRVGRWLRGQGMAGLVLVVGVAESLLAAGKPAEFYGDASVPLRVLGSIALAAAFLPRRRWPLLTVVLVTAIAFVRSVPLDDAFGLNLSAYLAAFIAGGYVRPLWLSAVAGALPIAGGVLSVVVAFDWNWDVYPPSLMLFFCTMTGAAWLTGALGRRRLLDLAALQALEEQEEQRRRRAVEEAVSAERLRVARELHDLVGHGLTSITLQSAAAVRVLDVEPERARAAVDAVADVAADVLDELGDLLAALDGHGEARPPQLAQLRALAARASAAGLPVDLRLDGDPAAVPPGPGGAAYRIVQEALTNARKHGGDGPVLAHVACRRDRIAIAVTSDGAAPAGLDAAPHAPPAAGASDADAVGPDGHGLLSMRERVRVYGGRLRVGPGAGDVGWSVEAELPFA